MYYDLNTAEQFILSYSLNIGKHFIYIF